ncbi:MAG: sulfotransferase family protein [Roseovarius sp.]|nr:sulfotransferase family protein [Roseovarius sp.]
MIISPGRNFIFVHIPKTAGTALTLAYEDRAMADDILIGDTPKARRRRNRLRGATVAGRLWKHSTLADISGLATPAFIAGAFVATLVRNPWDRMVSYYRWLRAQDFDHPAVKLAKSCDFSEFLAAEHTRETIAANPYGRYVTAADGCEHCRAFIRLEHFAEDSEPLRAHLGFRLVLPRVNTSDRHEDYRRYYSDPDAARVADMCAGDIARFGYRFG